jgi:formimidoylglutamate deiminase
LHEDFTAIHAIHLQAGEIERMGRGAVTAGACPTTERNLGDGILPADELLKAGVSIAFGTDSHSQTDGFENARELETNLRLRKLERAVLDGCLDRPMSALLLDCATRSGARSLHVEAGSLEAGKFADFFTVDLQDAAIAGAQPEDLLNTIVLSASPRAIADVVVHGEPAVTAHQHARAPEIIEAFSRVQQRLGTGL